jgi:hypothetical protein
MDAKLNVKKILKKKASFISTNEALKNVAPVSWSKEVIAGKKKVIVISFK